MKYPFLGDYRLQKKAIFFNYSDSYARSIFIITSNVKDSDIQSFQYVKSIKKKNMIVLIIQFQYKH